jgi:TolB-like protein/Flp pilus assembly protein TadD
MSSLAGVGSLVWRQSEAPRVLTMMAVPSIAVLPFAMPGDLDRNNSAGSLADEIAAGLMAAPRGFRIWLAAGHSKSQRTVDTRAAGRALNVRYLVLGSLRREGDGMRANVQLVEAESGRQLWAEPFDYAPDQPGAQNRTAAWIARLVSNALLAAESQRPLPAEALAEHYAILGHARPLGNRGIRANEEAIALFEKALALDPQSVPALQGLARTKLNAVLSGWVTRQERSQWLDQVEAAIERVIAQEPRDPEAYRLRGSLYRARGDNDQAIKALERAVDLYANFAAAHAELGRVKIEVGRASETVAHVTTAVRLGPTDPSLHIWCFWAGQAALHAGDDNMALNWLLRARQANSEYANSLAWLAVAYLALGREDEARAALAEFLIKEPGFTVDGWNRAHPRRNPELTVQRNRIESLLRRLGAPESRQQASSAN